MSFIEVGVTSGSAASPPGGVRYVHGIDLAECSCGKRNT